MRTELVNEWYYYRLTVYAFGRMFVATWWRYHRNDGHRFTTYVI